MDYRAAQLSCLVPCDWKVFLEPTRITLRRRRLTVDHLATCVARIRSGGRPGGALFTSRADDGPARRGLLWAARLVPVFVALLAQVLL